MSPGAEVVTPIPPPPSVLQAQEGIPLPPTTTYQEDLGTAGQRRINLIWETTQAVVAVTITAAMIYCAVEKIESKEITYAFISVVTMYFIRTNHTKVGGVPSAPPPSQAR